MTIFQSGTPQVAASVVGRIPTGTDGAAHLFVDPATGDDDHDGFTAAQAVATLAEANRRHDIWLELDRDQDFVVELAAATYAAVNWVLSRPPRRRLIIRGPAPASMELLASGAATLPGTADAITDGAAAFGDLRGQILRTFDPAAQATTEQVATIRDNTATVLQPAQAFSPIPAAGWTYQVLRPTAIIDAEGAAEQRSFQVVMPWAAEANSREDSALEQGPQVVLAWLRLRKDDGTIGTACNLVGGSVTFIGCLCEVVAPVVAGEIGLQGTGCVIDFGGYTPETADDVFGIPAADFRTQAGVGLRAAAGASAAILFGGAAFDAPVSVGEFRLSSKCRANFFGGAVHDARFVVEDLCNVHILAGFDPALAFLFRGSTPAGLNPQFMSVVVLGEDGVAPVMFRALAAGADAILADGRSFVELLAVPFGQTAAADIPGNAVDVADGAQVHVLAAIAGAPAGNFESTGPNVAFDDGVTAAWGAAGAALVGESARSRARVYKQ